MSAPVPTLGPCADCGTLLGFARGCRCEDCCAARAKDEKKRRWEQHVGNPRRVDATGTRRRIQALMRLGWSTPELARQGGWSNERDVQNLLYARQFVFRETAQRVADLYERLSGTLGPSAYTRDRAERSRYAPPLAWDEGSIDDPHAEPYRAPERPQGRPHMHRAEDIEFLRSMGETDEAIATRLGITRETVRDVMSRARRAS